MNIPYSPARLPSCPSALHAMLTTWLPRMLPDMFEPVTSISLSPLSGLTNRLYAVRGGTDSVALCVVRVYGSEEVFSSEMRVKETMIFARLAQKRLAPALLGVFANGRVEEFLTGYNGIDVRQLGEMATLRGVASELHGLHRFQTEGERHATVWHTLQRWMNEAESARVRDGRLWEQGKTLMREMRAKAEKGLLGEVVFCHNDLLAGNVLLRAQNEGRCVRLVDFEYAGWNYRGFDVGNLFAECMGGTTDGRIRPDWFPDAPTRTAFCVEYLTQRRGSARRDDVERLMAEAMLGVALAHLYWGVWGVVKSVERDDSVDDVDSVHTFDYERYGWSKISLAVTLHAT